MASALRIALAALVFGALAYLLDLRELAAVARSASAPWLIAAVAASLIDNLLTTQKWRLLLAGLELRVAFYPLFKTTTKGYFLSFFVPSALTADLYKGVALHRSLGSGHSITSSIVVERLLGVASIVTVGSMAIGWLPAALWDLGGGVGLALVGLALGAGLAGFLHADRILARLLPWIPARGRRVAGLLERLAGAFAAYRSQRRLLVVAFLFSVAIQFSRCTATWLVARSVADATPYWAFLVLVPYLYMVNMVPFATSRFGLEQGAFVVMFGAVGMPREVALVVSLLSVLASLLVALPGAVWLLGDRTTPRLAGVATADEPDARTRGPRL